MDRIITSTEANQNFSAMLRDVASGDSFTVTSRGRAIARVTPAEKTDGRMSNDDFYAYLRSLPVHNVGPWTRDDLYD